VIVLSFLRSAIGGLIFLFFTPIWCIVAVTESFVINNRNLESWIISSWGRVSLWLFGVKLEVKGLENIPKGSALFIFNHASFFDIFALVAAYPDMRFGAKIELFKIPLFGPAMRRLGVLPIARTRREEVFRVYQEAAERVKRGEKFALSPEGGRNYEEKLLPFKSGPFIFAINSGMPLVPSVIQGAHDVMGKGHWLPNWDRWSRTLTVTYLKPISTQNVPLEKRSVLQELAYQEMKAVLQPQS
jgi:1-acyl-sn-glycerol-3-phosphate acyltransferase